nr:hypothetical protein [Mesorhizobium sp.]
MLLAGVERLNVELVPHLPVGIVGEADAARLRDLFETRSDVHAIAEDIAVFDDDVADVDADAQLDAPSFRNGPVSLEHGALHGNGAGHRLNDRGKLQQQTVAGRLDDMALVLGDERVDQLLAVRLEGGQRLRLVLAHQARVTYDIGRDDGGKATFCCGAWHLGSPVDLDLSPL